MAPAGTSLGLLRLALEAGARLVIAKAEPTPWDHLAVAIVRRPIDTVLQAIGFREEMTMLTPPSDYDLAEIIPGLCIGAFPPESPFVWGADVVVALTSAHTCQKVPPAISC